jgi:hypothetical protein
MLQVIDQSRAEIADTRERIAGADALIASAAVAGHVQLSW